MKRVLQKSRGEDGILEGNKTSDLYFLTVTAVKFKESPRQNDPNTQS